MHHISVLFDSDLVQQSIFGVLPPLREEDVIGTVPWSIVHDIDTQDIIKDRLSRCLALGEPQAYRVRVLMPDGKLTLFAVRVKRVIIGAERMVHCVCVSLPAMVANITLSDRVLLELLSTRCELKEVARILKITSSAVSQRISALKRKLGVESLYELREIAQALADEQRWD